MEFTEHSQISNNPPSGLEADVQKICAMCKHYTPLNTENGQCPLAGNRAACDDATTCPSNMFELEK